MAKAEVDNKETKRSRNFLDVALGVGILAIGLCFLGHSLHHGLDTIKK